jgi:hypothetical protein
MVFFILNTQSLKNTSIQQSFKTKNKALDEIIKISTDFIKEEEGNKKARNAFVESVEELQKAKYDEGYYLIKYSEISISVYEKKKSKGYFSTFDEINEVSNYSIYEYNFTKEKEEFKSTINIKCSSTEYEKDNITGVGVDLLNELKIRLADIRKNIDN